MKAMLLTAGEGKRLRPLTTHLPKPLFPVGDRPVVLYLFDLLKEYGIKEVVLNLHHLADDFRKYLGDGSDWGVRIAYSPEKKLLGTGGGIRNARDFWGNKDILVINGDNLLDLNLEKLLQHHQAKTVDATMVLKPRGPNFNYTPIYLSQNSRVSAIGGKHKSPAYSYIGVQVLTPAFFKNLPPSGPAGLIEDGYHKLLRSPQKIAGFISTGYWKEISTLERYWETNIDFLRGRSPAYFYRGREEFTRRGIHAGKDCRLGPRITFYYPVYLGDNCEIGGGSILGPTVLVGAGSSIGENCHLENVLIWPKSKIRKGSRLKNVIITPFGKFKI